MARKLVLVVDDELPVRELLANLLSRLGYDWEAACDAKQAISKVEAAEFHLVIADLNMPGMNGYELACEIKRRNERIPVVLITGRPPLNVPAHIDRVLLKPFSLHELRDTLASFA